jgi:chromate transport protein ChrA
LSLWLLMSRAACPKTPMRSRPREAPQGGWTRWSGRRAWAIWVAVTSPVNPEVAGDEVKPPFVKEPQDKDFALDTVFFVQPLLLLVSVALLCWQLARGPRGRAARWCATVLTDASIYFMAVSLFDFFGRSTWMSPPMILITAAVVLMRRAELGFSLREVWSDKKERRALLTRGITICVLLLASSTAARIWFVVLTLVLGGAVAYAHRIRRPFEVSVA